jgi:hypothetical protein
LSDKNEEKNRYDNCIKKRGMKLRQVGAKARGRGASHPLLVGGVEKEGGEGGGRAGAVHPGGGGQEGEGRVVVVQLGWGVGGRPRGEERVAAAGGRSGGRQAAGVHVQPGVLLLPLRPPVLEPDLHLKRAKKGIYSMLF